MWLVGQRAAGTWLPWVRPDRTPARDQDADLVDRGQADEAVDDPAGGVRLAEVEAEDLRDEVELGRVRRGPS